MAQRNSTGRIVSSIVSIGVGLLGSYFVWLIATRSGEPRAYFEHRRGVVGAWEYPTAYVIASSAFVVLEVAVVLLILNRLTFPFWAKSLIALAVAFVPTAICAGYLMHAPPYFDLHIAWLATLTCYLLGLFVFAGIARLIIKLRLRRPRHAA